METPQKPEGTVEDLTPGTKEDSYFNFWEERKARVTKRLNLDVDIDDDEKYMKVKDVRIKRYNCEKIVVRITFVGKPGLTTKKDPVITFFGMDETGEISFTAYRDNVDKVLEMAEVGNVVEIQGFYAAKEKEGRFDRTHTGHDYRLTLVDASTIHLVDSSIIPQIPYAFVPLTEIEGKAPDAIVDVRGIIVRVSGVKEFDSRDVFITDSEDNTVKVSLYKDWKDAVKAEDLFKCLVLRRAVVREVYGVGKKYLRAEWNTLVDPALNEVKELNDWFAFASAKNL